MAAKIFSSALKDIGNSLGTGQSELDIPPKYQIKDGWIWNLGSEILKKWDIRETERNTKENNWENIVWRVWGSLYTSSPSHRHCTTPKEER